MGEEEDEDEDVFADTVGEVNTVVIDAGTAWLLELFVSAAFFWLVFSSSSSLAEPMSMSGLDIVWFLAFSSASETATVVKTAGAETCCW